MKRFARVKTLDEIRVQCEEQGLELNTTLYDMGQSDYVKISSTDGKTEAKVLFSTFNGRFFGTVGAGGPGRDFHSDDASLDGTPWFDSLLRFFYADELPTEQSEGVAA